MSNKAMPLMTKKPCFIQRCYLPTEKGIHKIRYDYMGSSEFECGDQATSLRRMHEGTLVSRRCAVLHGNRPVPFYLVARDDFSFRQYRAVAQGLLSGSWPLKEPTYLEQNVERTFQDSEDEDDLFQFDAWFDFTNDVFITLSEEHARHIIAACDAIKERWRLKAEWLASPKVQRFCRQLEKLRKRLEKAGKEWTWLSDQPEEVDGELMVWLNASGFNANTGYVTLKDLRDWLTDEGPIPMKSRRKRSSKK